MTVLRFLSSTASRRPIVTAASSLSHGFPSITLIRTGRVGVQGPPLHHRSFFTTTRMAMLAGRFDAASKTGRTRTRASSSSASSSSSSSFFSSSKQRPTNGKSDGKARQTPFQREMSREYDPPARPKVKKQTIPLYSREIPREYIFEAKAKMQEVMHYYKQEVRMGINTKEIEADDHEWIQHEQHDVDSLNDFQQGQQRKRLVDRGVPSKENTYHSDKSMERRKVNKQKVCRHCRYCASSCYCTRCLMLSHVSLDALHCSSLLNSTLLYLLTHSLSPAFAL